MVYKTLLLLALLLALGHSEVVILDDTNYTTFIQEHPLVFV
jgi:L-fucose mutarotase/ribose pyranase (RbsD/FucU family)